MSGSYDDINGTVKTSGLKRLTGRANLTQKFINDRLRFDVALTYSNVKNSYAPVTNSAGYQGSLIGAAIAFNPTYPVYNNDGSFYDPLDGNRNPAEMLSYFTDNDNNNRFLTSISGSFEITKGLTFKSTFGYDDATSERLSYADPRLSSNAFGGTTNVFGVDLANPIAGNGRGVKQNVDLKSILAEQTLTYDKAFSNSHLNVVGGFSYQSAENQYNGKVGWGLSTPVTGPKDTYHKDFDQYTNYYDYVPDYWKTELQSFFGRVNYSIADKYFLTGTVRSDGSSKFGTENKYGTFPAFAAKWALNKENFVANSIGKIFSEFAIRANYGTVGSSDGIGAYDALDIRQAFLGTSGHVDTSFIHQGNNKLQWETATTTGAGLDFAIANNRLSGTVDYFFTKRKNVLFYGPTPGGFSATTNYFSNLPGYVQNSGWEFSFNYKAIENKKFTWTIGYNMTFVKNVVKDMNVIVNTGQVHGQGLTGAYAQVIQDGYPLFTWKMPTFLGFDGNGDARYANGGKDEFHGSASPTFYAGLTNNFTLGRWNASVFVNSVRGFYVYNNTANALLLKGSVKTAHNIDYATANSPEDPINPGSVSTRFLEKGDFIRISNASIGYSFDVKSKVIKTLSVNAIGQNLALFTKYSGLDPEVNIDKSINGFPSKGFDYAGYPKSRVFTLGVNVGF